MKCRFFFLLICLVCSLAAMGMNKMSYRSYGLDFGLTDNSIRDIAEDKYGFLWIATDEGLNRVAGSKVEKFYKAPLNQGLSGNELNCLADDPSRPIMWIGTQRDGIVAYNYETGEFKSYHRKSGDDSSLITNDVTDFDFDNKGNLWISTYSKGIDCLDVASGVFSHHTIDNVEGMRSNAFWCVEYDDEDGLIYGGHVDMGFVVIDPISGKATNYTTESGLAGNEVWDIEADDDCVWIATSGGLSRYDRSTHEITSYVSRGHANVSRALLDRDSVLLVAMDDHGVLSFDKHSCEFAPIESDFKIRPYDRPDFLVRSDPNKLFPDSNGNIIIGTLYEGLALLGNDYAGFSVLNVGNEEMAQKQANQPPLLNVRDISSGKHGTWFGTNGSGLVGPKTLDIKDIDVVAVYSDGDRVWSVGNRNRLTETDLTTGNTRVLDMSIDGTRSVCFASSGDSLWIGSFDGLTLIDKNTHKVLKRIDVDRNYIVSVDIDKYGRLWVGTFGDGVSVFTPQGQLVRKYARRTNLPSNTINDVCAEGDDVWLATGEGLVRVSQSNLDDFRVEADSMKSIKSVLADKEGNIWYATRLGIGVLPVRGKPMFFSSQLPMSGFNNSSSACDERGRMYFGTNSGVLTFMPDYILSGKWLPQPMISNIVVNGGTDTKAVSISPFSHKEIRLHHDQNNFTIDVVPTDFSVDKYYFEYRLQGLENKWYPVSTDGKITLRELPYGTYKFQVRNAVMTDNENSAIASLAVTIEPPFWWRWWAKAIYIAMCAALVCAIFMWYRRKLRNRAKLRLEAERLDDQEQLQEERVKFFTNITHELRTPLTLINGPLEDLLSDNEMSATDRWKVGVIHKNAQRLLSLVNQLLDYRKTTTNNRRLCVSYGDIVSVVKDITMKYVELNRNPNVSIAVVPSTDRLMMYFDKEVLTMILDNLISNAMKYTDNGMISVTVAPEQRGDERWVRIAVRDTGHGIGAEALPHIFDRFYQEMSAHQASGTGIGLTLVKALVTLHKGEVTVDSARGVGTCFSVMLNRECEYSDAIHLEEKQEQDKPMVADKKENYADISKTPDNTLVLVVEDNPDILEYIRQSLSGIFDVRTAVNGRDGLEIAEHDVPDIIVTDIMMPVMDGMEMTELLRKNMVTSHIPVIMLTAKDSMDDRQRGYDAGVDSYITKPFNASLLIARINNIINRRHMLSEYMRSGMEPSSEVTKDVIVKEVEKFRESLSKLDREFVEKLDALILNGENPEEVNLEYLTDALCMSRPTLYRKMKAVTGMSGNEYIRYVRMRRAKELMLTGEYNITEISSVLGFSSPSYFRETFKVAFGMSPSDYMRAIKRHSQGER